MTRVHAAARFVAEHWLLLVAVLVNLAIAAPAGASLWDNDICATEDGEAFEACCTSCMFFCHCDVEVVE